ncbi:MAG: BON domain-containing protein [Steroidobacteraceae bacterium]
MKGFLGYGAVTLLGLACSATPIFAAEAVPAPDSNLKTIVVVGKRPAPPDSEVKEQVEAALRSDPFFPDEHVTVTIKDGVVTLHGIVFDEWDLRVAKRIAKRIPGVKRVINDLEIKLGGE